MFQLLGHQATATQTGPLCEAGQGAIPSQELARPGRPDPLELLDRLTPSRVVAVGWRLLLARPWRPVSPEPARPEWARVAGGDGSRLPLGAAGTGLLPDRRPSRPVRVRAQGSRARRASRAAGSPAAGRPEVADQPHADYDAAVGVDHSHAQHRPDRGHDVGVVVRGPGQLAERLQDGHIDGCVPLPCGSRSLMAAFRHRR
jgi:hypothetical protein